MAFAVEKVEVISHIWRREPNALALELGEEKGAFSRQLTERAWRRLFCARLSAVRIGRDAGSVWADDAWKRYVEASEEWSSHIMIDLQLLSAYYPSTNKRQQLEGPIQDHWRDLDGTLVALLYLPPGDPGRPQLVAKAKEQADNLNAELYVFVSGLEAPRQNAR